MDGHGETNTRLLQPICKSDCKEIQTQYKEGSSSTLIFVRFINLNWDSSVGIATRYELDGPGI